MIIKNCMENKRDVEGNIRRFTINVEEIKQKIRDDPRYVEEEGKRMIEITREIEKDTENKVEGGVLEEGNIRREEKGDFWNVVEESLKNEDDIYDTESSVDEEFSYYIPDEIEGDADRLSDKLHKKIIPFQMLEINKKFEKNVEGDILSNSGLFKEIVEFLDIDMNDVYSNILLKLKEISQMEKFSELAIFTNEVRDSYKGSAHKKTKNKLKMLCVILKLLKSIALQDYEEFISIVERLQQFNENDLNLDMNLQQDLFLIQLKTFIDMKDYVKALELLGQLENFHIDDQLMLYEIYFYTSKLFRVLGRKDEANALLSRLVKLVENSPNLKFLDARLKVEIAYVYLQNNNHINASELIQEIRELDLPKFGMLSNFYELVRIFTLLGHLEIKMGNFNQGYKDFTKAYNFSDTFYNEDTVVNAFAKYYVADSLVNLVLGYKRQEITMKRQNNMHANLEDAGLLYKQCIPSLSNFLSPLSLELAEVFLSAGIYFYTISNYILSLKYLRLCKKIFTLTQTFNYNFQYLCKWLNLTHINFGNTKSSLKAQAFMKSTKLAEAYYKSKSLFQIKTKININKIKPNIINIIEENIDYNHFLADYGAFISPLGKIIQFIRIKILKTIEFINIYVKLLQAYDIFLMIIAWHEPNFVMFEWHEKLFQYKIEDLKTVDDKRLSFWEFNISFAKVMLGLIRLGAEGKFIGLIEPDSFFVNQKREIKILACLEENMRNMGSWEGFLMKFGIESQEIEGKDCRNCNKEADECVNCENNSLRASFRNHSIEDSTKRTDFSLKQTKIITKNNFVPPELILKKNESDDCKISLGGYYTFSFSLIILSFLDRSFHHFIVEEYDAFIINSKDTKELNLIVRRYLERQNLSPLIKKVIIKTLKFDCSKRISPEKILKLLDYYLKNKNTYGINFD